MLRIGLNYYSKYNKIIMQAKMREFLRKQNKTTWKLENPNYFKILIINYEKNNNN